MVTSFQTQPEALAVEQRRRWTGAQALAGIRYPQVPIYTVEQVRKSKKVGKWGYDSIMRMTCCTTREIKPGNLP